MEAIALIISALTAGAMAALQETAGTAIKDAYQGLAGLIRQKFSKDPKATIALDSYAEDPETWQKPLEKSIRETGAVDDQEILLAAQKMLELLKSQASSPKYDVDINGNVKGFVQGDHAQVTMNFGNEPEKAPEKKSSKKS
jgi:hypothetical protein